MSAPAFLPHAAGAWAAFYAAHPMVSVLVRWLHLSGIVVGGGTALVADRRVLMAGPSERPTALSVVAGSHRIVVGALVVIATSGGLMTASDLDTFVVSQAYWTKLCLVLLLVLNGFALRRAESAAARHPSGVSWWLLRATSAMSLLLWLGILYAGLWLTVAA